MKKNHLRGFSRELHIDLKLKDLKDLKAIHCWNRCHPIHKTVELIKPTIFAPKKLSSTGSISCKSRRKKSCGTLKTNDLNPLELWKTELRCYGKYFHDYQGLFPATV